MPDLTSPRSYLLALLLPLTACSTPTLQLPSDLAPAERLEVEGMRRIRTPEALRFGSFHARDIDRSWTRGGGLEAGGVGRQNARQTYSFRLADAEDGEGHVSCESSAERSSVDLKVVTVDPGPDVTVSCTLAATDGLPDWHLRLETSRDRHLEGRISTGGQRYTVRGAGKGGRFAPAQTHGYHILQEGRTVGAVETVGDGAVWLASGLTTLERRALALAAVALLLYQEPDTE